MQMQIQIQHLPMETIADLVMRAPELGGFIELWYEEGEMAMRPSIRMRRRPSRTNG
jgi:hypothetical protein